MKAIGAMKVMRAIAHTVRGSKNYNNCFVYTYSSNSRRLLVRKMGAFCVLHVKYQINLVFLRFPLNSSALPIRMYFSEN